LKKDGIVKVADSTEKPRHLCNIDDLKFEWVPKDNDIYDVPVKYYGTLNQTASTATEE